MGLTKTVQDKGLADRLRPVFTPTNPANSIILRLRKTNIRNEVTAKALSTANNRRAGVNRKPLSGGIA